MTPPREKAIDQVLNRLRDRGDVIARGEGWKANCPAHTDSRPSLDIDLGENGRVLFMCRSKKCTVEAIARALGLSVEDLFQPEPQGVPRKPKRTYYLYRDESGSVLYRKVRVEPGKVEPKDFHQERADGRGGWARKLGDVRRVLYRLPELLAADRAAWLFFTEGEKDADRLAGLGMVVTTSGGTNSWRKEFAEHLRGRRVVILPDNDDAGRKHGEQVRESLKGVAREVVYLALPGLAEKGDVSDWLDAGGTRAKLLELVEVRSRADKGESAKEKAPPSSVNSRSLAEIETQEVRWLWPGWLPSGMLSILDGDPSEGKSLITLDIAARISRGHAMPFSVESEPACVLIMAAEDSAAHTIKPRVLAADGNLELVRICETIRIGEHERPIRMPDDLDAIEREVVTHKARLLIIDPLLGFLSQAIDSHKDQSVRDVLHRLKLIADRTACAILGLRHLGKGSAGVNALYRGMGSIAITAAARSAFTVGAHPHEEGVRVMASTKVNLIAKPRSLAYRIKDQFGNPVIDWTGECDVSAADLGAPVGRSAEGGAIEQAKSFLHDLLTAQQDLPVKDIEQAAKAAGLSWTTVRRASAQLGVIATKQGFSGRWIWRIPNEGAQPSEGPEGAQNSHAA